MGALEAVGSVESLAERLKADILRSEPADVLSNAEDSRSKAPDRQRELNGAPLPVADPRLVMETGTVRLNSPYYIRRAPVARRRRR